MGLAIAGGVLALSRRTPHTLPGASAVAATSTSTNSSSADRRIKVYVTGAVARPGVYTFYGDRRVEDAIAAAGGFAEGADPSRVNLAARLRDEEQIYVPRQGESAGLPNKPLINLNTASATELKSGLSLSARQAEQIVEYRNQHGPFKDVEDLRRVPLPQATVNKLRPLVTLQ